MLGVIGLIVAFPGIKNAGSNYENFLLIISYWIGPWLGVVFVDWVLRRGTSITALIEDRKYLNWAGPIAMFVGDRRVAIWLFSNQTKYQGVIVKSHPAVGDLTFEIGFVIAAVLYFVLFMLTKPAARPGRDRGRVGEFVTTSSSDPGSLNAGSFKPAPSMPRWLAVAVEEARAGLAEGGIPIGAALVRGRRNGARPWAQPSRAGR